MPAWVLVPGFTDNEANREGLVAFAVTLENVERVEVLPFHQMGRAKWERLGQPYALADTPPPESALVERVVRQFRACGLDVL